MDTAEEDVRKMTEFIKIQKGEYNDAFQIEFQEFINCKQDYEDEEIDNELLVIDEENNSNFGEFDVKDIALELPADIPITTLTGEERSAIESCSDPTLKQLLKLNRSKNMQLMQVHKKIMGLIKECEAEIEDRKGRLQKNNDFKSTIKCASVWKLAAPFFKDTKYFQGPSNADTIKKREEKELSVYEMSPSAKWSRVEFDRLIAAVKCNYNINRQNNVVKKISALRAMPESPEDEDNKSRLNEIVRLECELEDLKTDDSVPPLKSDEFVNWYKVCDTFLKNKRSALECQAVWHILVHPQISKQSWTDEESDRLKIIAEQHLRQDWDLIAVELNTNRTGFTACLHYFSKLCEKFKKQKFTSQEDTLLVQLVTSYKVGNYIPWNKVVHHYNNRSRHQLYHRYTYFLSQQDVKRGKFSEAEDILLVILVKKFGRNFKKCAEYFPNRSQIQLKSRFNSNLQRQIKKGTFSVEDDEFIYAYVQKHGSGNWNRIAELLTRCGSQVRQRYQVVKNYLKENPIGEIKDIPRRRHNFEKDQDVQWSFILSMADQFSNTDFIPTLSMIEESLQMKTQKPTPPTSPTPKNLKTYTSTDPKMKNVDTLLTDFFSSTLKVRQQKLTTQAAVQEAVNNAQHLISVLGANLDLPDDLESNPNLDAIDVEILEALPKTTPNESINIQKLIPPSLTTLVGLRSLIIKNKEYKAKEKIRPSVQISPWTIEQKLLKIKDELAEIMYHRDLFSLRFDSLFSWSAIMSLEKPQIENDVDQESAPPTIPSTAPPPEDYTSKMPKAKRRKIDLADLSALQNKSKGLTAPKLVDKSVVDRLMHGSNQLNVIKLVNVTGPDGVARPVLQPNAAVPLVSEEVEVDETDVEDVRMLDLVLNNVKAESLRIKYDDDDDDGAVGSPYVLGGFDDALVDDVVENDESSDADFSLMKVKIEPGCSKDEYRAVKNDVLLLDRILKLEKEKCFKSDPDDFLF